jgi:hypothetical protein
MKRFLIILALFILPFSAWSFEYVGLGIGPNFHLHGDRPSNFFVQGEWQPHKILGTRVFLGFNNGFWLGVAINFRQHIANLGRGTIWDANFSVPFIFNIRTNSRIAFVGVTAGTTFSFDMDGKNVNYVFITPFDFMYTPLGWVMYPSSGGGWNKDGSISYLFSVGLRFAI